MFRIVALVGSAKRFRGTAVKAARGLDKMRKFSERVKANAFSRDFDEARAGDIERQFEVAQRYYEGHGIGKSYEDAALWYRRAAEGGHSQAQSILGMMTLIGRGTPRDPIEACKWIELAVSAHEEAAKTNRSVLQRKLTSQQLQEGKERARKFTPRIWKEK